MSNHAATPVNTQKGRSQTFTINSPSAMEELGVEIAKRLTLGSVVILTGDLGAGKTQLSKGIARGLGITEPITSPTFNLVQVYNIALDDITSGAATGATYGSVLQHFDLYRLEHESELDDIDYFGMIGDPQAISLVEWGDKFSEALPPHYLAVNIEILSKERRLVVIELK